MDRFPAVHPCSRLSGAVGLGKGTGGPEATTLFKERPEASCRKAAKDARSQKHAVRMRQVGAVTLTRPDPLFPGQWAGAPVGPRGSSFPNSGSLREEPHLDKRSGQNQREVE